MFGIDWSFKRSGWIKSSLPFVRGRDVNFYLKHLLPRNVRFSPGMRIGLPLSLLISEDLVWHENRARFLLHYCLAAAVCPPSRWPKLNEPFAKADVCDHSYFRPGPCSDARGRLLEKAILNRSTWPPSIRSSAPLWLWLSDIIIARGISNPAAAAGIPRS